MLKALYAILSHLTVQQHWGQGAVFISIYPHATEEEMEAQIGDDMSLVPAFKKQTMDSISHPPRW